MCISIHTLLLYITYIYTLYYCTYHTYTTHTIYKHKLYVLYIIYIQVVDYYCSALKTGGYPEIRAALCIGGEQNSTMVETAQRRGLHCIVATPGRLNDHLNKKRINMDICKYFVLDEGDRMLDLGFDEEVSAIKPMLFIYKY